MVVKGTSGKIRYLDRRRIDFRGTILVWKAKNCVCVRDKQIFSNERHTNGRMESIEEHTSSLGDSIPIRVPQ